MFSASWSKCPIYVLQDNYFTLLNDNWLIRGSSFYENRNTEMISTNISSPPIISCHADRHEKSSKPFTVTFWGNWKFPQRKRTKFPQLLASWLINSNFFLIALSQLFYQSLLTTKSFIYLIHSSYSFKYTSM